MARRHLHARPGGLLPAALRHRHPGDLHPSDGLRAVQMPECGTLGDPGEAGARVHSGGLFEERRPGHLRRAGPRPGCPGRQPPPGGPPGARRPRRDHRRAAAAADPPP
eukprot:5582665-Pyramimonas_sp.AAC.1